MDSTILKNNSINGDWVVTPPLSRTTTTTTTSGTSTFDSTFDSIYTSTDNFPSTWISSQWITEDDADKKLSFLEILIMFIKPQYLNTTAIVNMLGDFLKQHDGISKKLNGFADPTIQSRIERIKKIIVEINKIKKEFKGDQNGTDGNNK